MNITEATMPEKRAAPSGRLLVFRVGARRCGIPLADVRGVREVPAGAEAAGATLDFQGSGLAVVDAGALGWGGRQEAPAGSGSSYVIVGAGAGAIALRVEAVEGIVEAGEIRELPALVAPYLRASFRGVALQPEGELLIVDAGALAGREATKPGGRGGPRDA